MKTDAMDAAVAEAVGDGSAAGNIVVGSQLQIVGTVSTRSMTDRPSEEAVIASYWSVGIYHGAVGPRRDKPRCRVSSPAVSGVEGWPLAKCDATTAMTMTT